MSTPTNSPTAADSMATIAGYDSRTKRELINRMRNFIDKARQITGTVIPIPATSVSAGNPLVAAIKRDVPLSYWDFQSDRDATAVADQGTVGAPLKLMGTEWRLDTTAMRTAPYAIGRIATGGEDNYTDSLGIVHEGAYGMADGAYDFTGGFTVEGWWSPGWNWISTVNALLKNNALVASIEHRAGSGFFINNSAVGADVTGFDRTVLHHVMITVDPAGAANLYWDGQQVGATTTVPPIPASVDRIMLGATTSNKQRITSPWVHWAVYGRALDAAAAQARYAAASAASPMPRRGNYNIHTTDLKKLFANNPKSTWLAATDKVRFLTWWGGFSGRDMGLAEKAAGTDGYIVIDKWQDVQSFKDAGLVGLSVIGSENWSPDHLAAAGFDTSGVIVGKVTEDEPSLDGEASAARIVYEGDLDRCDPGFAAWANNGFDMLWRPVRDVMSIINAVGPRTGRWLQINGMDYYIRSTNWELRAETGRKLGLIPADMTDAQARDNGLEMKLRHSYIGYLISAHMRQLYTHDTMANGFVATGHANAERGGMPVGREVRGEVWAKFIAGDQIISWFYHSFPSCPGWWDQGSYTRSSRIVIVYKANGVDKFYRPRVEGTTKGVPPTSAPTEWEEVPMCYLAWESGYAYRIDANVTRNGSYYTAVRTPKLGVPPESDLYNDDTDTGSWVKWSMQTGGLRGAESFAPGMSKWTNRCRDEANRLAPIIHSPADDLALADSRLIWRYWPNRSGLICSGDSKAYAWTAVMQGWDQWSGTYTVNVPPALTEVEVFHDLTEAPTVLPVSNGQVDLTFAKDWDVRIMRWDAAVANPAAAAGRNLIAHIGDSLSSDDEHMEGSAQTFISSRYKSIAGFANVLWNGKYGRGINFAAPGDPSTEVTTKIIDDMRAQGTEPDVWVIALATNSTGNLADDEKAMDEVLAKLGPNVNVVAVGMATSGSRTDDRHKAINDAWRTRMAARGSRGYFADYLAHLEANPAVDWNAYGTWFYDYTHMTLTGYTDKYDWLAGVVNSAFPRK